MIEDFLFIFGGAVLFGSLAAMCVIRLVKAWREGVIMVKGRPVARTDEPREFAIFFIALSAAGSVLAPFALFFLYLAGGAILHMLLWS